MSSVQTMHPVDEVLPIGRMGVIALQHVLVMYGGAVAVPPIVGGVLKLPKEAVAFLVSADLFACGIITLIQSAGAWRFGVRLPVVMGVSFAAVGSIVALAASGIGITGLFGAGIAAGVAAVVVAPFVSRLLRYFPPLVTGTIITVIGITGLRIGIASAAGGVGVKDFGDPANLAVVALVLATVLVIGKLFDGFIANAAVLIGLIVGFAAALALGLVEFGGVREAEWVALVYPFRFGAPSFELGAIVSMCIVMIVVMIESAGMFLALGEICGKAIRRGDLARGLAADGLGAIISGAFNAFPCTSYSQNVGLVAVTGVRSRWVVAVAGGMLIVLALVPKLGALVASIPQPVLGGAGLAIFGMVAATGIKILARVDYASRHNLIIIGLSIAVGMIPMLAPQFFAQAPKWAGPVVGSGITLAAVAAALLNALFNGRGSQTLSSSPPFDSA